MSVGIDYKKFFPSGSLDRTMQVELANAVLRVPEAFAILTGSDKIYDPRGTDAAYTLLKIKSRTNRDAAARKAIDKVRDTLRFLYAKGRHGTVESAACIVTLACIYAAAQPIPFRVDLEPGATFTLTAADYVQYIVTILIKDARTGYHVIDGRAIGNVADKTAPVNKFDAP